MIRLGTLENESTAEVEWRHHAYTRTAKKRKALSVEWTRITLDGGRRLSGFITLSITELSQWELRVRGRASSLFFTTGNYAVSLLENRTCTYLYRLPVDDIHLDWEGLRIFQHRMCMERKKLHTSVFIHVAKISLNIWCQTKGDQGAAHLDLPCWISFVCCKALKLRTLFYAFLNISFWPSFLIPSDQSEPRVQQHCVIYFKY